MKHDSQQHILQLDGLRGIAILFVLCFHFFVYGVFQYLFYFGWSGVDLFFVLSGFLITGILLDSKSRPGYFKNFWLRRVLRIFPLYYAVLIVFAVMAPHFTPTKWFTQYQFYFWTYSSNYLVLQKGFLRPLGHFWSLSIEEQFYVLWPVLVYWLTPKKLIACCAILIATGIAIRYFYVNDYLTFGFPPAHLDGLMAGAIIAVLIRYNKDWLFQYIDSLFILLFFLLGAYIAIYLLHNGTRQAPPFFRLPLSFTLISLFFGSCMVLSLKYDWLAKKLSAPVLVFFGRYSYGMYVFNSIFFYLGNWAGADRLAPLEHQLVYAGLFILTVGVSFVSYHLFEVHFLKLKEKFS